MITPNIFGYCCSNPKMNIYQRSRNSKLWLKKVTINFIEFGVMQSFINQLKLKISLTRKDLSSSLRRHIVQSKMEPPNDLIALLSSESEQSESPKIYHSSSGGNCSNRW